MFLLFYGLHSSGRMCGLGTNNVSCSGQYATPRPVPAMFCFAVEVLAACERCRSQKKLKKKSTQDDKNSSDPPY